MATTKKEVIEKANDTVSVSKDDFEKLMSKIAMLEANQNKKQEPIVINTSEVKEIKPEISQADIENAKKMEERVPFYAMKDNDKYKDDIFVCVNGDSVLIPRGKEVMIKRKHYQAIMQSQSQDLKTYDYMESLNKFAN